MRIRPYRAQAGFIQNFIIPGIILIGLVIAGIAMLSNGAGTNTQADKDNVNAGVIITQGVKLQSALERAIGDGVITRTATGNIDLTATLQASSIMPTALFPAAPADALATASSWSYAQGLYQVKDAQATAADVGSSAADDVMFLPNVSATVCASINYRLYGGSSAFSGAYAPGGGFTTGSDIQGPSAVVPAGNQVSAREGCVSLDGSTVSYIYYKAIGVH